MERLIDLFFKGGKPKVGRLFLFIICLQLLIWGSIFTGACLIVKWIFF